MTAAAADSNDVVTSMVESDTASSSANHRPALFVDDPFTITASSVPSYVGLPDENRVERTRVAASQLAPMYGRVSATPSRAGKIEFRTLLTVPASARAGSAAEVEQRSSSCTAKGRRLRRNFASNWAAAADRPLCAAPRGRARAAERQRSEVSRGRLSSSGPAPFSPPWRRPG